MVSPRQPGTVVNRPNHAYAWKPRVPRRRTPARDIHAVVVPAQHQIPEEKVSDETVRLGRTREIRAENPPRPPEDT